MKVKLNMTGDMRRMMRRAAAIALPKDKPNVEIPVVGFFLK